LPPSQVYSVSSDEEGDIMEDYGNDKLRELLRKGRGPSLE
jgi:hypothetical protein